MDKLRILSKLNLAVSVGIGVVFVRISSMWVEQLAWKWWISILVALVIVGIMSPVCSYLFTHGFDNMNWLRRLLLGNQFIEGVWFDLMKQDGKSLAYGITNIKSSGSQLQLTGEDFDLRGEHGGYYYTDMLVISWPVLKYKYTYQRSDDSELANHGYGEIKIDNSAYYPVRYEGFYFNLREGKRVSFESWRVRDKHTLELLNDPKTRRDAVCKFFGLQQKSKINDEKTT